jgi:hypothetical protein
MRGGAFRAAARRSAGAEITPIPESGVSAFLHITKLK